MNSIGCSVGCECPPLWHDGSRLSSAWLRPSRGPTFSGFLAAADADHGDDETSRVELRSHRKRSQSKVAHGKVFFKTTTRTTTGTTTTRGKLELLIQTGKLWPLNELMINERLLNLINRWLVFSSFCNSAANKRGSSRLTTTMTAAAATSESGRRFWFCFCLGFNFSSSSTSSLETQTGTRKGTSPACPSPGRPTLGAPYLLRGSQAAISRVNNYQHCT